MKNHLFPPVHVKPALHKIDSEAAWDQTQSFSQPYRPSARVRQLEQLLGVQEGRAMHEEETMPKSSLQAMVRVVGKTWVVGTCMHCHRMSTQKHPRCFHGGRDGTPFFMYLPV